ncbi:MAG: putative baseplate assembly protein [Solirubrobacteraceae bacterium]|nr:putative baseplate assembly protein [Solirubrobacteraceae bacterium]
MKLPEITLDDRDFQSLVSEARMRIAQSCPEWTDHNVSDPGITLIEQFAWMTDLTLYRLNRIPDKLHIALMELLGIRLDPAMAAKAGLRFRTVAGARGAVEVPALTEVGTRRSLEEEPIVFQVDDDFTIAPLRPTAYTLVRGGRPTAVGLADGVARPAGADQLAFSNPPTPGDALCLGFEEPVGRLVLRIEVDASEARGAGVDPTNPPLQWEVSTGTDQWAPAEVLEDQTGGFNYGAGVVELQLPERSGLHTIDGESRHWVRCVYRLPEVADGEPAPSYKQPPEIYSITARPVGALLPATHSVLVRTELLGISDGTPGQEFPLQASPVLPLGAGEVLEVLEPGAEEWVAWAPRESLVDSGPQDRHFVLDLVSGTIELGPAIRGRDGSWTQHGAIPPSGARLRMSAYRHGGGIAGNVATGTLTMLKTSLPGIDRVANPAPAEGGIDAESLAVARQRAGMEVRSRSRAVTAGDFEFFAAEHPNIARAICLPPSGGGPITVRLLRNVQPSDARLDPASLQPTEQDFAEVAAYLDERRTIGSALELGAVRLRGATCAVKVYATGTADLQRVHDDIEHALYSYLNPLIGGSAAGPSSGWPFGRALNPGELFGIVQGVRGVDVVELVRVYETDLETGDQQPEAVRGNLAIEPDEVIASGTHLIQVEPPRF